MREVVFFRLMLRPLFRSRPVLRWGLEFVQRKLFVCGPENGSKPIQEQRLAMHVIGIGDDGLIAFEMAIIVGDECLQNDVVKGVEKENQASDVRKGVGGGVFIQKGDIAMSGDGFVAIRHFHQRKGEFDPGDLFELAGLGGEETGFSLARANIDEMIERDLRFHRLFENDFQMAAGDGLIKGGVLEVGPHGGLQDLPVDDGLKAQAIQFLEEKILNARPVARAVVEDGEVQDVQCSLFLDAPSRRHSMSVKRLDRPGLSGKLNPAPIAPPGGLGCRQGRL